MSGPSKFDSATIARRRIARLVVERSDDRGARSIVADGPERGYRRLATARVLMLGGHGTERHHGRDEEMFSEGEGRGVHDEGVLLLEHDHDVVQNPGAVQRGVRQLFQGVATHLDVAVCRAPLAKGRRS